MTLAMGKQTSRSLDWEQIPFLMSMCSLSRVIGALSLWGCTAAGSGNHTQVGSVSPTSPLQTSPGLTAWGMAPIRLAPSPLIADFGVYPFSVSDAGNVLVQRSVGDARIVWDVRARQPVRRFRTGVMHVPGSDQSLILGERSFVDDATRQTRIQTECDGSKSSMGFSASGRFLACLDAANAARVYDLASDARSQVILLPQRPEALGMTPADDGQRLAVYSEHDLNVFELTTGQREWASKLSTTTSPRSVAWHPDGKRLVVVSAGSNALDSGPQLELSLLGNGTAWHTNVRSTESLPRWSPDGELLHVAGALFRLVQGELYPLFDVAWVAPGFDRAVLPNGQLVALPTRTRLATLTGNVLAGSSDGRWLIEDAGTNWLAARDTATGNVVSRLNKSALWTNGNHESPHVAFIAGGNAVLVQHDSPLDEPGQSDTPWRWDFASSRLEPWAPAGRVAIDRVHFDKQGLLSVGSAFELNAERNYWANIDLSNFRLTRFERVEPGSPSRFLFLPAEVTALSAWGQVDCAEQSKVESPDGTPWLAATCGYRVQIWEREEMKLVLQTPKLEGVNPFSKPGQLTWDPSGSMLAVAAMDRVHLLCLPRPSRIELVLTRPRGAADVELIAIAPTGEVDGTNAGLGLVRYETETGPSLDLPHATRTYGAELWRRGLLRDFVTNCKR